MRVRLIPKALYLPLFGLGLEGGVVDAGLKLGMQNARCASLRDPHQLQTGLSNVRRGRRSLDTPGLHSLTEIRRREKTQGHQSQNAKQLCRCNGADKGVSWASGSRRTTFARCWLESTSSRCGRYRQEHSPVPFISPGPSMLAARDDA